MMVRDFLPTPRIVLWTFGAVFAISLMSLLGYLSGLTQTILFWSLLAATAVLMWWRREWIVFIVLAEIIAGGKGYLFSVSLFGQSVSFRLALFAVAVVVWALTRVRDRQWRLWHTPWWRVMVLLVVVVSWGVASGLIKNDAAVVFFDVNGYLFFGLLFIVFDCIRSTKQLPKLISVLTGATLALIVLTLSVFSYFSIQHANSDLIQATRLSAEQLAQLGDTPETAKLGQTLGTAPFEHVIRIDDLVHGHDPIYRWLRDDGLAEVSYLGNSFFRVFYYSHIWVVFGLLLFLLQLTNTWRSEKRLRWFFLAALILSAVTLAISFSRSLLIGAVLGIGIWVFFLPPPQRKKILGLLASVIVAAAIVITVVAPSLFGVVSERVNGIINPSQEIASQTRVNLLKPIWEKITDQPFIGNGFGTTVVVASFIPGTDTVNYISVNLFEWTYLDIWVKIGAIGLAVFLAFFAVLLRELFRLYRENQSVLVQWLIISLLVFIVINISTPYLNHPIGIGFLILTALVLYLYRYAKDEN